MLVAIELATIFFCLFTTATLCLRTNQEGTSRVLRLK